MGGQAIVAAGGRAVVSLSRSSFLCSPSRLWVSPCPTLHLWSFSSSRSITAKRVTVVCSNSSSIMHDPFERSVANTIHISSLEQKIFDTLKAVILHFQLNLQLRVAGGWVRDKLLGKECHDIDIALEDMLGKAFCDKVNEYLRSVNQEVRNVCLIQSNPDQSKHLETARMKIFGVEIDFVNLRAETYAENSRIPNMKFGTPEEDALRRDLTINSLFYNINTSSIEDFTGRGLSDLRKGIIATPLPPKTTFLDDPLRVLRAVRFASRFDYRIQEDLREAAADVDVRMALSNKVSPERIGVEIDLMIRGANPVLAIKELVDLDIFWVVFQVPQELKNDVPDGVKRLCLRNLKTMSEVLAAFGSSKLTANQRRIGFYAALLLPLKSFHINQKSKQIQLAMAIIRDSLKLKAQDANMVVALHKAAEDFKNVKKVLLDEEKEYIGNAEVEDWEVTSHSRKMITAGFWMNEIKELWRVAVLLESLVEPSVSTDVQDQQVKVRADICLATESLIMELGLENIWELKPLLDGKEIMLELGLEKGGPKIKEWVSAYGQAAAVNGRGERAGQREGRAQRKEEGGAAERGARAQIWQSAHSRPPLSLDSLSLSLCRCRFASGSCAIWQEL